MLKEKAPYKLYFDSSPGADHMPEKSGPATLPALKGRPSGNGSRQPARPDFPGTCRLRTRVRSKGFPGPFGPFQKI